MQPGRASAARPPVTASDTHFVPIALARPSKPK